MPSKLSRALLIFALMVIAVVSWQWIDDRNVSSQTAPGSIEMAENQSDYYLRNFEIINISNGGAGNAQQRRRLKVTGKTLSHHYIEGYSVLDNPTVLLETESDEYWLASARSGRISAEFDVLDLLGTVKLTHNKPNGTADAAIIKVDTETLNIDTGRRIIETMDPVTVNGQGWNYKANSMRAEIDDGRLSFESGVEAKFVTPN